MQEALKSTRFIHRLLIALCAATTAYAVAQSAMFKAWQAELALNRLFETPCLEDEDDAANLIALKDLPGETIAAK